MNASPYLLTALVFALAARPGTASQNVEGACQPGWIATFGSVPGGVGLSPVAATTFDDGSGSVLVVGGQFTNFDGVPANRIAKWDGAQWSALGSGLDGRVTDMVVHDDGLGGGPALYVAGDFGLAGGVPANNVARWDGTSWSALGSGTGSRVEVLGVFDEGGGPRLFAGGTFVSAGGGPASRIARWDGATWSSVGATGTNSNVHALQVFDDGAGGGPALYVGGFFSTADGTTANGVARWDGSAWSALGTGLGGPTNAPFDMAVFDDGFGGGPALYLTGFFTTAGGTTVNRVARWDGSSWSALGSGLDAQSLAIDVYDDGSGDALFVAGFFTTADGVPVNRVARWDGSSWSALGLGLDGFGFGLAVHDAGGGSELYALGSFSRAGEVTASRIAAWDGTSWSGVGNGIDGPVRALAVFDDGLGGGSRLYAGGEFTTLDGVAGSRVASWDGTGWAPLGTGMDRAVDALQVYDDGGGAELYAGGSFLVAGGVAASYVASWNGTSWAPLGAGGPDDVVRALAVYDDGGGADLYAGGDFSFSGGAYLARWDGASWTALGSGTDGSVLSLTVFDAGGGAELYAGGTFTMAGGSPASRVARWDGATWSSLGSGVDDTVRALAAYDDGGGAALYAGGGFTTAGGAGAAFIASWDGVTWSAVGVAGGVSNSVEALFVFDDGAGPALFAGGRFGLAGATAASRVARWDGSAWSALGFGVDDLVSTFAAFDDGSGLGPALFVGGEFLLAADSGDGILARWGGCSSYVPPTTYCTGKTSSAGCVPFVTSVGVPSATSTSSFQITSNDVVPSESGFLLYAAKKSNLNFHGGKLCVKAPLVRTPAKAPKNPGGGCSGWILRRNFNATIQNGSDPTLSVGAVVFTQWRQRDPADPAGFGDSLSDGLRFAIAP